MNKNQTKQLEWKFPLLVVRTGSPTSFFHVSLPHQILTANMDNWVFAECSRLESALYGSVLLFAHHEISPWVSFLICKARLFRLALAQDYWTAQQTMYKLKCARWALMRVISSGGEQMKYITLMFHCLRLSLNHKRLRTSLFMRPIFSRYVKSLRDKMTTCCYGVTQSV